MWSWAHRSNAPSSRAAVFRGKRRVPKNRNPQITDEAIRLFRRGCEIIKAGDQEFYEEDSGLRGEYLDIVERLDWQLLGLVCDCGTLEIEEGDDGEVVTDDGSGTYRATIPRARELHRLLKARTTSK
jgi:hypothetical protein